MDQDIGLNADIVYSLDDATMPFTIGPTTGVITVADDLDYEIQREYSVSYLKIAIYHIVEYSEGINFQILSWLLIPHTAN